MKIVYDGICYHVEKTGKGFPLFLLHGFTGTAATWHKFKEWEEHSNVLAMDIIGHGQTDSPKEVVYYEMEYAAHVLAHILDELSIEKTDILGYSMGGRLGLTFAVLYPQRVRRLILESASPGLKTEQEQHQRISSDEQLAAMIHKNGVEFFVEHWENIPMFQSQKERLSLKEQEMIRQERLNQTEMGLINSLKGMGTGRMPSLWEKLPSLEMPVYLLTGELDQKFMKIAEEICILLPNAAWVKFAGVGHAIHVEKPEKFGTIISELLSNE